MDLKINHACMFWDGKNPSIAVVGVYGGTDAVGSHLKKDSPTSEKSTPFENCAPIDGWFKLIESIGPVPWYESIPDGGVLCWVWGVHHKFSKDNVSVVLKLRDDGFYVTQNGLWTNARPLTPEEAMNLVYQAEEETPKLEDKWLCWCWDDDWTSLRSTGFYDSKNKSVFNVMGERSSVVYDNYEPIPRSQWPQWAIDAHKTLED